MTDKTAAPTYLGVDEIINASEVEYRDIKIFGGTVRVGSLTSDEVVDWLEGQKTPEQRKEASADLVARSLVDAEGKRIGLDESGNPLPKLVTSLRRKKHSDLEAAVRELVKLNGLTLKGDVSAEIKNV